MGAKHLAHNLIFDTQMNHVIVTFNFVREMVMQGLIQAIHISTRDQIIDGFTKPLPSSRFHEIKSKLGVAHKHNLEVAY